MTDKEEIISVLETPEAQNALVGLGVSGEQMKEVITKMPQALLDEIKRRVAAVQVADEDAAVAAAVVEMGGGTRRSKRSAKRSMKRGKRMKRSAKRSAKRAMKRSAKRNKARR